jgi:hypothetical protein
MQFKCTALALILFSLIPLARSEASTLAYDLGLTTATGQAGTGMFAIDGPIPTRDRSVFTAGRGLSSLRSSIDEYNFSLASGPPLLPQDSLHWVC